MDRFEQIINIRKALKQAKFSSNQLPADFADYPWDKCVADQIKAYGDKSTAERVCGAIKAQNMEIEPNPCWSGYEPIGLKDDGSPNCVPMKASKETFVIPSPSGNEDEQTYISRCISDISSEYDAEGQAYAVCKGKWDEK